MSRADGIESVNVSRITGSALLFFDRSKVEAAVVFGAVLKVLGLESEVEKTPDAFFAKGINNGAEALNRALYEKSGGLVDLWTAIPIALAALGIYKLSKPGGFNVPGGFTLLWWAYMQLFRGEGSK
jgi:hypothetical protein